MTNPAMMGDAEFKAFIQDANRKANVIGHLMIRGQAMADMILLYPDSPEPMKKMANDWHRLRGTKPMTIEELKEAGL